MNGFRGRTYECLMRNTMCFLNLGFTKCLQYRKNDNFFMLFNYFWYVRGMGLGVDTPGTSKNPTTQKTHGLFMQKIMNVFMTKMILMILGVSGGGVCGAHLRNL